MIWKWAASIIAVLVIGGAAIVFLMDGGRSPPETEPAAAPATAAEEKATQDSDVALQAEGVANLGIRTVPAQAAQFTEQTEGFGQVISVDAWAQADAELATLETAKQASDAALARAQGLFQADISISRQALEAAQRQAATDAAQLALSERKAAAVFGLHPPWRNAQERATILQRLTAGRETLIRATLAQGYAGPSPQHLTVRRPSRGDGTAWTSTAIWDAPADPTIPGRSFFTLVSGTNLTPGERVLIGAPQGGTLNGTLVPADAIVLSEGQAWCFVAEKPTTFARRPVDLSRPLPGGYFVTQGVMAGDAVVISGAALLLARQMNPSTESAD